MKNKPLIILSAVTIAFMLVPTLSFARDRQDRERDDSSNSSSGSSVSVQSSVIISTGTGGNDGGDGGSVTTGDQDASVTVETIINGEVVQTVHADSDDRNDREHRIEDRRQIYEDRDRGINVDTSVDIIEEEENDTGNNNKDGEDGEPGEDGKDGDDADPEDGEEDGGEGGGDGDDGGRDRDDRRERTPREVAFAVGEEVWSRLSNFVSHVLLFWV